MSLVKVDIYDEASAVISKAKSKEKSIKSLVYDSNSKNIRQLYALVCESLKYATIIDQIIENVAFLQKVPWMDRNLALVLLYDFLFGKKLAGACSGKYRKAVVKQKKELKAELQKLKEEKGATRSSDLLPSQVKDEVSIPRYVRVNLLKTSMDDVIAAFIKAGYTCVMTREEVKEERRNATPQYISNLCVDVSQSLGEYEFAVDFHIDDVLVFASRTDFHNHPLYLDGSIILMDKASCFPAYILSATPGSTVIDACAAPGNKTSHLASLLGNEGKIYSYDLDAKRIGVMDKLLERAGVSIAETRHQDFLLTDPCSEENMEVEYIIVDPSCSGSGMATRKDYLVDEDMREDKARLISLQQLQCRILSHALSFPSVKRVVYSTCSLFREENEEVVKAVLKQSEGFRLVPAMEDMWDHRGLSVGEEVEDAGIEQCCIRASPRTDLTNGFFVALFERTGKRAIATPKKQTSGEARNGLDGKLSKKKKKTVIRSEERGETKEDVMETETLLDDQNVRKKKKKKIRADEMTDLKSVSNDKGDNAELNVKKHKKVKTKAEEEDKLIVDNCEEKKKKRKGSESKSSSLQLETNQEDEDSQPSAKKKKKKEKKKKNNKEIGEEVA